MDYREGTNTPEISLKNDSRYLSFKGVSKMILLRITYRNLDKSR